METSAPSSLFRGPEPPPTGEGRMAAAPVTARSRRGAPRRDRRGQRLSLPLDWAAARPASRRATGIRNGEQET